MPGMSVAKLKVLVEADTRAAEKKLAAFHRHLEDSFGRSGEKAGRAADRGVSQGFDRDRNLISRAATKAGGDAGNAFSNSFAEKVARQAGGVLLQNRETKIAAKIDSTGLRREVARAARVAGAGQEIRIPVKPDRAGFSEFGAALRKATGDSKGLRAEISKLAFPVVASGASLAANAIAAVGSAAIGAASAIAPLGGLLGALPGFAAAGAQGFGVLRLGVFGLKDALKAMGQAQNKSGVEGETAGQRNRLAAEAVAAATRRVKDAQQNLTDAQRSARTAEQDLTFARRDARRALQDLRLEVEQNALSQERAALNVKEAQVELRKTLADPKASALRRQDAELSFREAVFHLKEIGVRRRRAAQELADANRAGISGSDQVQQAQQRLADAQRGVTKAAADVADAQRAVASAVETAAFKTDHATGAVAALQAKLNALSPAGRKFVKWLFSLKPLVDRLKQTAQGGLLPGVQRGLQAMVGLFPMVNRMVGATAKVFGNLAEKTGKMLASPAWKRDLQTIMGRNVTVLRRAGDTALNFADALRNITIAAGPLVDWLSKTVLGWSDYIKGAAQAGRDTGKLQGFFEDVRRTTETWLRIIGNAAKILFNVGRAARDLGDDLVTSLDRGAAAMAAFTGSVSGQNKLRQFFDDMRPTITQLGLLVRDLANGFVTLARNPDLPRVISMIRTELLPVVLEFLQKMKAAAPVFIETITVVVGGMLKLIDTIPGFSKFIGLVVGMSVAFRAVKLFNTALGINAITRGMVDLVLGLKGANVATKTFAFQAGALLVKLPLINTAMIAMGDASLSTAAKFRTAGLAFGLFAAAAAAGAQQGTEQAKMFDSNRKQVGLFAKQRDWLNRVTTIAITKEQKARQAAQDNAKQQDKTSESAGRAAVRLAAMRAQTYSAAQAQDDFKSALATVNTSLVDYRKQAEQAGGSLAHSLGSQKMDFQAWSKDVQTLIKRGMSPKEILTLRDMGPQYIHQFANATDIEFAKLKILWQKRVRAARIAAQLEALLAGQGSAQSIAEGLTSKDKIVRDAARNILSHLPKKVQTEVEVVYNEARNLKILRKFAKNLHTTIGGKPVLIDPRTGRAEPIHNARGNLFGEKHSAQIARGGAMRVWAEPETGGEAYIPLARSKRPRSTQILQQVAGRFGMGLVPMAQGGIADGGGASKLGTGLSSKYVLQKLLAITNPSAGGDVGRGGKPGPDGLAANVHQARELIRSLFGIQNIGGFASSGHVANSDHYTGHALDVMTGNRKLHNAIIRWFLGRSDAKYWISYSRIASASRGWVPRPYHGTSPHRDHVHLSFFGAGGLLDRVGKMASFAAGGIKRGDGPAYLHAGEGVLNQRAMSQVGPAGLNALNRGSGGGVGGVYIAPGAVQIVVQGDIAGGAVLQRLEATVDRKLDDLAGQILAGRRS